MRIHPARGSYNNSGQYLWTARQRKQWIYIQRPGAVIPVSVLPENRSLLHILSLNGFKRKAGKPIFADKFPSLKFNFLANDILFEGAPVFLGAGHRDFDLPSV